MSPRGKMSVKLIAVVASVIAAEVGISAAAEYFTPTNFELCKEGNCSPVPYSFVRGTAYRLVEFSHRLVGFNKPSSG